MTTSSEHAGEPDHAAPVGVSLQTDGAKATVEEIKAENVALKKADVAAEAQAEAVVEEAKQLAEVAEEVLEELKEAESEAGHA
jgi:hypothetical protein